MYLCRELNPAGRKFKPKATKPSPTRLSEPSLGCQPPTDGSGPRTFDWYSPLLRNLTTWLSIRLLTSEAPPPGLGYRHFPLHDGFDEEYSAQLTTKSQTRHNQYAVPAALEKVSGLRVGGN